jgi:hypothetical protein
MAAHPRRASRRSRPRPLLRPAIPLIEPAPFRGGNCAWARFTSVRPVESRPPVLTLRCAVCQSTGRVRTVATGDRTYVGQPTALGNLLPRRSRNRGRLGILSDAASDEQVLSVTGYHFNYRATSIVHCPSERRADIPLSRLRLRDAEGWCDVGG